MSARSPWEGASRAPLRLLLAFMLPFDAVVCTALLWGVRPSTLSHPLAPRWLLALGTTPAALVGLVLTAAVSSWLFARRAGQWLPALVSLVATGLLVESQAAVLEGPMRFLFFSGAAMSGWCAGLLLGRWSHATPERSESLAEQGAVSVLAACYLGSFVSKMLHSGLSWADPTALQSTIASQHAWGNSALTDALTTLCLEHSGVTRALALVTLAAQASAVFLPFSARGRSMATTLLLCFHTGVAVLTPIVFGQSMLLLCAFGYPWPRWYARLRGLPAPGPEELTPLTRGAAVRLGLATMAVVALAWLPPVRAYTAMHHTGDRSSLTRLAPERPAGPAPLRPAVRALLGDVGAGSELAGFTVTTVREDEPGVVRLELAGRGLGMRAEVLARGRRPGDAPHSSQYFSYYYGNPVPGQQAPAQEQQLAVLDALAARLAPREALPEVAPLRSP